MNRAAQRRSGKYLAKQSAHHQSLNVYPKGRWSPVAALPVVLTAALLANAASRFACILCSWSGANSCLRPDPFDGEVAGEPCYINVNMSSRQATKPYIEVSNKQFRLQHDSYSHETYRSGNTNTNQYSVMKCKFAITCQRRRSSGMDWVRPRNSTMR